jgi:hypothetical protein
MKTQILPTRRTKPEVSPDAVDEIFARLARRAFDPMPLRELADDLDRQHERLQSLLRDIDSAATSE